MKLAYIALRLTDVVYRTRQPFLGSLRRPGAEARPSESVLSYPRAILYWRKLSERLKQPLVVNRHTTRNLKQISKRIDMHFSCLSQTFVSHTLSSMQPWVAGPKLSVASGWKHRPHLWATHPFGVSAPGADSIADRTFGKAPSSLRSATSSSNDIMTISAAISPDVKQRPQIETPSLKFRNQSSALSTSQPLQFTRRLQAADESSSQARITIPRKQSTPMHPAMLPFRMPAKSLVGAVNKKSALFTIDTALKGDFRPSWIQRAAPYKLANEPEDLARKSTASVSLVWRNPLSTENAASSVATMNMQNETPGKLPQHFAMDPDSESRIAEKVISQTRQVLVQELLNGTNLERLADDVMHRLDKRLRIERERRGL